MDHVDVHVSDTFDRNKLPDLMALYAGQWWTKDRETKDVGAMLDNTDLFATVFDRDRNKLLGFARVVTDHTYVAVVLDVIVEEKSQGKGYGALLMDALVSHPSLSNVQSLELSCQQALVGFYERWGFTSRVGGSRLMRRTDSAFFLSE